MQQPSISIVAIAHNEERHIRDCLRSLERQALRPARGEIIVVAHNCTDRTEAIVAAFPAVRLVRLRGPAGPVYARMKGFAEARGEIVACLDGDCIAEPHWLSDLVEPLANQGTAAVGGVTIFHGNWFAWLGSYAIFYLANRWGRRPLSALIPKLRYPVFWGTSFACRRADYHRIGGLEPLLELRRRLMLPEWAEDFYLSLKFWQIGNVAFTRRPVAHAASKQRTAIESMVRVLRQQRGEKLLLRAVMPAD